MPKKPESDPRESSIASGWIVSADAPAPDNAPAARVADIADQAPATELVGESNASARSELTNVALVLFGVFGGMYLLYTVGWFLIAQYFASANNAAASTSGIIGGVLQVTIYWAAALAPAGWFATVYVLGRTRKAWFFPVWLMVGLVVLLPLPLFTTGGV